MLTTPFTEIHEKLGAKMAAFAGYNMPISYAGISIEHLNVRNNVGVFDVSHMGEFIVRGEGALALINKITTNDVTKLSPGKVQYSCMPNADGGIIDDLLVYCLANETYMLVVNASNIDKDWEWLVLNNTDNVTCINISQKTALLAVQGPNAAKVLQPLTSMNLTDMAYYTFDKGVFAGEENVLISATGYTGSGGFEIYMDNHQAIAIWEAIMQAGAAYNIAPAGLAARDTLRLEKGFCLYGNDINDTTSPIAAGLGWITKFTKEFTARAIIEQHKKEGTPNKLVGFEMIKRGIPRQHYEVCDSKGTAIGEVTSGTQAPSLGKAIGMAYVAIEHSKLNTELYIKIREQLVKAKVVAIPFV
jgi:aminomethyltransferase